MKLSTVPLVLAGNRRAILEAAMDPWAPAVGAVLVLSASLARNYDRHDLWHEPWRLAAGFGASVALSLLLFAAVYVPARARAELPGPVGAYAGFLGVFWLMAPMAWLYGIPYERLLSPLDALNANAWTLALVAAWRVALAARVLSVLFNASWWRMIWVVMLCGDAVALVLLSVAPLPTLDFMGGFHMTEEERFVAGIACSLRIWGTVTVPVWVVGAVAAMCHRSFRPRWARERTGGERGGVGRVMAASCAAALAWAAAAAAVQSEQVLRRRAEELIRAGEIGGATEEMSRRRRDEYPPVWDLPPRLGYNERQPGLDALVAALQSRAPAPWVDAIFLDKVKRLLREQTWVFPDSLATAWESDWLPSRVEDADKAKLERWRAASALLAERDPSLSDAERESLRRLTRECEQRLQAINTPPP